MHVLLVYVCMNGLAVVAKGLVEAIAAPCMLAYVSSYNAGCTFKSAPYDLAVDVLRVHALFSSN